jgi:hypothetical protein
MPSGMPSGFYRKKIINVKSKQVKPINHNTSNKEINEILKTIRPYVKEKYGMSNLGDWSLYLLQQGEIIQPTDERSEKKAKRFTQVETLKRFREFYNQDVNSYVEKIKTFRKENKKVVKKLVKNKGHFVEFTPRDEEDLISILSELKKVKGVMKIGIKSYTLSDRNFELVNRTFLLGEEFLDGRGDAESDADFALTLHRNEYNTFTIGIPEPYKKKKLKSGFFPYTHTLDYDFSKLQIFNEVQSKNYKVCCFINCLIQFDFEEELIENIKQMLKTNVLSRKSIHQIGEKFNIRFKVCKDEKYTSYGAKEGTEYLMYDIDEHYLPKLEIPITKFAIEHYEDIKDLKEWWLIYKKNKGYYERDKKKTLNSNLVVNYLKQFGRLEPITKCDEIYNTRYYNKVEEFTETKLQTIDTIPNVYIDKQEVRQSSPFYKTRVSFAFDFETITQGNNHYAYSCAIKNDYICKSFRGYDCANKMLKFLCNKYKNKEIYLIAHNAGYDFRFLFSLLSPKNMNVIQRGKSLLQAKGNYFHYGKCVPIVIQDSYAFIACPLNKFGKMFNLPVEKEILPYGLYSKLNIEKQYIDVDTCIKFLHTQFECNNIGVCKDVNYYLKRKLYVREFFNNVNKWGCYKNKKVDILKYNDKYCEMDCIVLWEGWKKFRKWIQEVCYLDTEEYVSIPSLANDYMLKNNVYENVYQVGGITRDFIQKCVVGGRTMTAENKKIWVKDVVADYDGVSLYPSSMDRLSKIGGYLQGKPKILENKSYDFLKQQDGYFVQIKINKVNKHYKFPLISKLNDEGVRIFTNDMENEIIYVDKITLEDLIEFHDIKFDIIMGYYYDEGRNDTIGEIINHLFNTRKQKKAEGNPIESVYKLLMNSAYGKTILKPFETKDEYIPNEILQRHISRNYDDIKEIIEIADWGSKVIHYNEILSHYNNAQVGVEVLSMSKRIMNEVMCCAEDLNCGLYYQDTDSIHILKKDIPKLEKEFETKYNRTLTGKEMGQFHIDFSSDKCKGELFATESIFLGKKCYIDKIYGDNPNIYDTHVRMKGIPSKSILHYALKNNEDIMEIYKDLYNGTSKIFDLSCGGLKCNFAYDKDFAIKTLRIFEREIQF